MRLDGRTGESPDPTGPDRDTHRGRGCVGVMPRERESRDETPASTGPRTPATVSKLAEAGDKQNRFPPQPSGGADPVDILTSGS